MRCNCDKLYIISHARPSVFMYGMQPRQSTESQGLSRESRAVAPFLHCWKCSRHSSVQTSQLVYQVPALRPGFCSTSFLVTNPDIDLNMAPVDVKISEAPELESTVEDNAARNVVKQKVETKWTSYIWDTLDKSPEERKFLFKLDAALLTFASLGMETTSDCLNPTTNHVARQ